MPPRQYSGLCPPSSRRSPRAASSCRSPVASTAQEAGSPHQPLETGPTAGWAALRSELDASAGDSALLVIPGLTRIGGAATHRLAIRSELSALAGDVFLVSVVGDQLTLLNDLYLQQVANWRMSKRLAGAVPRLLTNVLLDHETSLRPWYADTRAGYAAVPMTTFMAENPVAAVLRAAGAEVPAGLPPVTATAPLPARDRSAWRPTGCSSTYLRAEIADFRPDDPGIVAAEPSGARPSGEAGLVRGHVLGVDQTSQQSKALARFDAVEPPVRAEPSGEPTGRCLTPSSGHAPRSTSSTSTCQVVDQVQRYVHRHGRAGLARPHGHADDPAGAARRRRVRRRAGPSSATWSRGGEPLARRSVLLPARRQPRPSGERQPWGSCRGRASTPAEASWPEARETGAATVLVSSDAAGRRADLPRRGGRLRRDGGGRAGSTVRVVVVVREQIGYINSLYCQPSPQPRDGAQLRGVRHRPGAGPSLRLRRVVRGDRGHRRGRPGGHPLPEAARTKGAGRAVARSGRAERRALIDGLPLGRGSVRAGARARC